MLHPALDAGQVSTLYRVRTYAAGIPLLSFWARGIGAALSRAAWLAPRHEVVEVHAAGGIVASWHGGEWDDPLPPAPICEVRGCDRLGEWCPDCETYACGNHYAGLCCIECFKRKSN
jgi:hypothetical protein